MQTTDWLVIAGGIAAIFWVNWYFFLAERGAASVARATASIERAGGSRATHAAAAATPIASATIIVDGGYSPSTIRVPVGEPVRLIFDRRDTSSCSEEVVFPDFGIRKFLPTGERTAIEITPSASGRYEFMCGMSMLRGTLIAE